MTEYWNYIVTAVGLVGFWLAGKKVWWAWYINIANQILWFVFGFVTGQWGFVIGSLFYTVVFTRNAVVWTKEHRLTSKISNPAFDSRLILGKTSGLSISPDGVRADMVLNDKGVEMMKNLRFHATSLDSETTVDAGPPEV